MSKQCLDVQQMQHLQELGLNIDNASLCYYKQEGWEANYFIALACDIKEKGGLTYYYDSFGNKEYILNEIIPAYNLQDVLDALPKEIKYAGERCWLCFEAADERIGYYKEDCNFNREYVYYDVKETSESNIIDSAYRLLCWCIENKFVETGKNEERDRRDMERKVGEIFEYEGEWYQCVEGTGCFRRDLNSDKDDGKDVMYKRLEKFGEPYDVNGKTYQLYKTPLPIDVLGPDKVYRIVRYDVIEIEIKFKSCEERK